MDAGGLDSVGRGFSSAKEMWREEIGIGEAENSSKRHEWYQKGIAYWQGVEASVDGVLGGYGHVNEADVKGSEAFLNTLLPNRFGRERRHLVALDCGSGIGRVTKNLLLRYFNEGFHWIGKTDVPIYDGSWTARGSQSDTPVTTE